LELVISRRAKIIVGAGTKQATNITAKVTLKSWGHHLKKRKKN